MSSTPDLEQRFNNLKNVVENNDAESLQTALESTDQTDVLNGNHDFGSLLHMAVEKKLVDVAKLLLAAKADVNRRNSEQSTPLMIVAECDDAKMVELLLKQPGIDVDAKNNDLYTPTALMVATYQGNTDVVVQLLEANANLGSCLLTAAGSCNCATLQLLIQHKADLNIRDHRGNGCLHVAASVADDDYDDTVSLLLSANATVDMTNDEGTTPLMKALGASSDRAVRALLAAKANVNHRDKRQRTALFFASHKDWVELLLRAGADPNAEDDAGCTALFQAMDRWRWTCSAPLLVNAKADVNHADWMGTTPLVQAVTRNEVEQVRWLLENGADLVQKGKTYFNEHPLSARQVARVLRVDSEVYSLFECSLCGWEGMCCVECRKKYCALECDKFSDPNNSDSVRPVDCRVHQKVAHQAVLDWTLSMSSLNLPPYVVEMIFDSLKLHAQHEDYQQRKGIAFLWIPKSSYSSSTIDDNFVHLIIEERTHSENIKLFISVQKALRESGENRQ